MNENTENKQLYEVFKLVKLWPESEWILLLFWWLFCWNKEQRATTTRQQNLKIKCLEMNEEVFMD